MLAIVILIDFKLRPLIVWVVVHVVLEYLLFLDLQVTFMEYILGTLLRKLVYFVFDFLKVIIESFLLLVGTVVILLEKVLVILVAKVGVRRLLFIRVVVGLSWLVSLKHTVL